MTHQELTSQILYILSEYTGVKVTEGTLLSDLPIDSLDHAELACKFEFKFGLRANNQDWFELWGSTTNTVLNLIEFIKAKYNAK